MKLVCRKLGGLILGDKGAEISELQRQIGELTMKLRKLSR